jgi:hypothetical protein
MKTLKLFKTSQEDLEFAESVVKDLNEKLTLFSPICIGNSITLYTDSSESQYVYGLSLLTHKLNASKELGLSIDAIQDSIKQLKEMFKLNKELSSWRTYTEELKSYSSKLKGLLSIEEKVALLEKPKKP